MNLFTGIIIFVALYIFLSWFAKTSSRKIAQFLKRIAIIASIGIAILLTIGGKFLFSLPFLLILLTGLKIKGLTAIQAFQLFRLIQFLRNSGRFSGQNFGTTPGTTSLSIDEAYKLLGLKKGCQKNEVIKAAAKLQKKIHPDINRDINTERLSQLVNEAKEKILKTDFN